ncbi:hypothetical protein [Natronoglomus mannanivorans]|uniref:PH domain-containing protein n=1 Tax=Natronoglomus mannanivorans TaxID=2979990 RepID=A0AAP2YWV9_9EURY|nr:hypothetical protein [Halobacteria archaeon AArc-xg1-1]
MHVSGRPVAALGAGVYAAGAGATGLVLSAAVFDRPSPWVLASVALLVGILVALAVGFAPDRIERFRHRRRAYSLLVLPVAGAIATLAVAVGSSGTVLGPGFVLSIAAFVGWTWVVHGAETLHAQRALEEGCERIASLPAVADRTVSRRLRALNAVFGVSLLAFGIVAVVQNATYVYLLVALGPLAAAFQPRRSVTLTDRGLLFESRFGAKLLEWSAFGGYYVGDGDDPELVVLRSSGWRDDLTFEGEHGVVDETVVAAIDRYLPRSLSPAILAGGLARNGDGDRESGQYSRYR